MELRIFVTRLQQLRGQSSVQAYTDVRIATAMGSIDLSGFSIVQKPGNRTWVAFPSKQGKNGTKYFPVVEAEGRIKKQITNAILDAYQDSVS